MEQESDTGYIEYKRTIKNITPEKLISYASQMKYRLTEGNHICYYYIGINDNGTIYGLGDQSYEEVITDILKICSVAEAFIVTDEIIMKNDKIIMKFTISDDISIPEHRILLIGNTSTGKSTFVANCLYNLSNSKKKESTKSLVGDLNKNINFFPLGYNFEKNSISNYVKCEDIVQIKSDSNILVYLIDTKLESQIDIKQNSTLIFITSLSEIKNYSNNEINTLFMLQDDTVDDIILEGNVCIYNNYLKYDKLHNILRYVINTTRKNNIDNTILKSISTLDNSLFVVDILYNFSLKKYLLLVISNIQDLINNYTDVKINNVYGTIESIYLSGVKYDFILKDNSTYTIIVNFNENIHKLKFKTLALY